MFDTIILLSGPAERHTLPRLLFGHNPHLMIIPAATVADLQALPPDVFGRARLIAFVTGAIVPAAILARLGYGAINFHPGPPAYPGWAPSHFALYNGETEFGVTAHHMVEQVDAGPIIDVTMFPIPARISSSGLEGLAYAHLTKLFWQLSGALATNGGQLPALPLEWGHRKYSRRAYRAMCEIPLDIPADELKRRIQVFGGNDFGMAPAIHMHGIEFRAVVPADQQATRI